MNSGSLANEPQDNEQAEVQATDNVRYIDEAMLREQRENAKQQEAPASAGPPDDIYAEQNDALVLGPEPDSYAEFLSRSATFLTGEMWGAKDRRNTQDGDWKSATLTWSRWIEGDAGNGNNKAWGLSRHSVGKFKEGSSIVLGSSIGGARKANAMDEMFALGLDIDSGAAIEDVVDTIRKKNLFALIYTSHSHGKSGLEIKRDDVMRKLQISEDPTLPQIQEYLRVHSKSRYEESFIAATRITDGKHQTKEGVKIVLSTPPLDKFRIIFPFDAPVKLIDLAPTQQAALEVWEDKITGMAWEELGVHFDTSCTDPSRLFYTARHAKGAEWECMILRGEALKFEDVPEYKKHLYTKHRDKLNAFELAGDDLNGTKLPICQTPSGKSLNIWHHHAKDRFMLADLLEDTVQDKIRHAGNEAQGHVHVECPFEHEHTSEGGTGCDARNAIDSSSDYWTWGCKHDSCQSRHKLEFLEEALRADWFEEDLLFDEDGLYLEIAGEEFESVNSQKSASAVEFEPVKDWLPPRYAKLGGKILIEVTDTENKAWAEKARAANDDGKQPPPMPTPAVICGDFDVVGRSSNPDGTESAGRIISFAGENGKRVEVTLSLAEIRSDPKAVFDILSDRGLWLPVSKNAKINMQVLLNEITPKRQIPTVESPGWIQDDYGDIVGFMHPTGVFEGAKGTTPMRLLEDSRIEVVKSKGSLEGYTKAVVESFQYADSNFYWPLGVASGFAGALLGILKGERTCGYVLTGGSSLGKSTGKEMGAAVTGSPDDGAGLFHSAKTTTNAIEDLCIMATHNTFMFDEIGAFENKKALESILYGMAVGVTKARKSGRNVGLAKRVAYKPFIVMSSEYSTKQEIESGGGSYRDGLVARFPDIDVSGGKKVGKSSIKIMNGVKQNYGHAGPIFVRYLIETGIAFDHAKLQEEVDKIIDELAKGKPSLIARAAKPFAITLRAGQLAADAGVLGEPDKAKKAIEKAVKKAWKVFLNSDEASAASGGEALLDRVLSRMHGKWDRTIIEAGEMTHDHTTGKDVVVTESENNMARGTPLGWYDDEFIYLDWNQLANPEKVFGMPIKRPALVKVFGNAVVWKRDGIEAPQSKLPARIAEAAGGGGRAVKNLKLKRSVLGM